jgi:hypothetical protein
MYMPHFQKKIVSTLDGKQCSSSAISRLAILTDNA